MQAGAQVDIYIYMRVCVYVICICTCAHTHVYIYICMYDVSQRGIGTVIMHASTVNSSPWLNCPSRRTETRLDEMTSYSQTPTVLEARLRMTRLGMVGLGVICFAVGQTS